MGTILAYQMPGTGKFLPVLLVQNIVQQVQSTTLIGQSLLFCSTGYYSQGDYFKQLLGNWTNQPFTWGELSMIPNNNPNRDYILFPQAPPVAPVATAVQTLLAVGTDPIDGYWAQFAGNYNLYFGIFKNDWRSTVGQ